MSPRTARFSCLVVAILVTASCSDHGVEAGIDANVGTAGFDRTSDASPSSSYDATEGLADAGKLGDGSSEGDAPSTVDAAADAAADPDDLTDAAPGEPGAPCEVPDDCYNGYCIPTHDGYICPPLCDDGCPAGWSCKQIAAPDQDPIFLCVPVTQNLCAPCGTDADCQSGGDPAARCIAQGPTTGSFCGIDCTDTSACPADYTCVPLLGEGADGQSQCQPTSGDCSCSPYAISIGASTPCTYGSCEGTRTCTEEGLSDCTAGNPIAELCDEQDNDCDGETDEDFQTAGFYNHPNHCGACGNDCEDAIDNGTGTCGLVLGLPTCVPADCDEGYAPSQDNTCEPTAPCINDPNGTPCDADNDPCTQGDACLQGTCVAGQLVDCTDEDPCTEDLCQPLDASTHTCEHPAAPSGTPCDDHSGCTIGDVCGEGICTPGAAPDCDDALACTTDTCTSLSATTYSCTSTIIDDACLIDGACVGQATPSPTSACLTCNPTTSQSAWTPSADGTACDADEDGCTTNDSCLLGACQPGAPAPCDDGTECTIDQCTSTSATTWSCSHPIDLAYCLIGGTCYLHDQSPTQCQTCDPQQSQTAFTPSDDGSTCNADDDGCTVNDTCVAGLCTPGGPAPCDDDIDCTTDTCTPDGWHDFDCANDIPANTCVLDGACTAAGTINPTHQCQTCDPAQSATTWTPLPDGSACSPEDACTPTTSCQAGICTGPTNADCSPGDNHSVPCGNCGLETQICDSDCTWGDFSACQNEGPCTPGEIGLETEACACGQKARTRTCTDGCTWGTWSAWSACTNNGECEPGDTHGAGCGNCGTQTQTCTDQCSWGSWSSCTNQGSCTPGDVDLQNQGCGNCGTQARTRNCQDNCTWGSWTSWSSCTNQGSCNPGAWTGGCPECEEKKCKTNCQWGSCQLAPGNECLPQTWQYCGPANYWQWCNPSDGDAGHCQWYPCQPMP